MMNTIDSLGDFHQLKKEGVSFLLFIKTDGCSVCDGLLPQVEELEKEDGLPFYMANASQLRELAGELLLFSAPVVLLFAFGQEYARFARFVPMGELTAKITALEAELNV